MALFLAISGELARFLSVENDERDDIVALLDAQAAGDARGMIGQLNGCSASPSCVASASANAAKLRRPGSVKILTLTSPTAYSLTGATGKTRVAWTVIGRLPIVQCVLIKRGGNALTGISLALLALSPPIQNEADC